MAAKKILIIDRKPRRILLGTHMSPRNAVKGLFKKKKDYFGIRHCFRRQKYLIIVRHGNTLTAQDVSPNLKSSDKCSFLSLQIVCIWHLTKQLILLPPKNWSGESPWSYGEYSTKVKRESAKFAVRQPLSETLWIVVQCEVNHKISRKCFRSVSYTRRW